MLAEGYKVEKITNEDRERKKKMEEIYFALLEKSLMPPIPYNVDDPFNLNS